MAKTKKPDAGRTIIDVAHPGKSAPSANSKSVIITSRPLLKDPMMVDGDAPKDGPADNDSSLSKVPNRPGVQPLTAPLLKTEESDEPAPEADSEAAEPSEDTAKPAKPVETVAAEDNEPAPDTEPTEKNEAPADDKPDEPSESVDDVSIAEDKPAEDDKPAAKEAVPEPAESPKPPGSAKPDASPAPAESEDKSANPKAEDAAPSKDKAQPIEDKTSQEAKRQAAVEKLADSKKYYLPINAVEKRRSRRFVIVGIVLSLLLIVAWADIALDAGLVRVNGIKPLTHFFSN